MIEGLLLLGELGLFGWLLLAVRAVSNNKGKRGLGFFAYLDAVNRSDGSTDSKPVTESRRA